MMNVSSFGDKRSDDSANVTGSMTLGSRPVGELERVLIQHVHEAVFERRRAIWKLGFTGQLHERKRPFQLFQPLLDFNSVESKCLLAILFAELRDRILDPSCS